MSSVIHGASHKAIKFLRKNPASISVYWIYASRTNHEGVAWPTVAGLARDTAWSKTSCEKARSWLVQHEALEVVKDYTRPEWRNLPAKERAQKQNFDKSEYYRPTGHIKVDGVVYPMLYHGQREQSDIEEFTDVLPRMTSDGNGHQTALDVIPDSTELNTIDSKYDSIKDSASQNDAAKTTKTPKQDDQECDNGVHPRKQNLWYDTVKALWGFEGSRNGGIQKLLRGELTGAKKKYNLEIPLTEPAQIEIWSIWYKRREGKLFDKKMNQVILPRGEAKIQSSVMEWQTELTAKITPMPSRRVEAVEWEIDEFVQLRGVNGDKQSA